MFNAQQQKKSLMHSKTPSISITKKGEGAVKGLLQYDNFLNLLFF